MSETLFGWQGFSFRHPADYCPATLEGDRRRGYARLSSAGRTELQVRWETCRSKPDLGAKLAGYLRRLESDARRRRESFRFDTEEADNRLEYRWSGGIQGRGCLFFRPTCRRVFFLEALGGKKDSLLPVIRQAADCFDSAAPGTAERWSLLGLSVSIPSGARLRTSVLQTGKTQLHWLARGATLSAGRSGLGRELLGKMDLESWARGIAPRGEVALDSHGVRIESSRRTPFGAVRSTTLARFDEDSNQLLFLSSMYRDRRWEPAWDWFGEL